jgi:hypothetical protein
MPAPTSRQIEPDAGRAGKWPSGGAAIPVIGKNFIQEIWTIDLKPFPSILTLIFENLVKRRTGDVLAARTTAVARLDHR